MSRYEELRALAAKARAAHPGQWGGLPIANPSYQREWFIAAASPDVILALLDERERLLTALEETGHDLWADWGEEGPVSSALRVTALLAEDRPPPSWVSQTASRLRQMAAK